MSDSDKVLIPSAGIQRAHVPSHRIHLTPCTIRRCTTSMRLKAPRFSETHLRRGSPPIHWNLIHQVRSTQTSISSSSAWRFIPRDMKHSIMNPSSSQLPLEDLSSQKSSETPSLPQVQAHQRVQTSPTQRPRSKPRQCVL